MASAQNRINRQVLALLTTQPSALSSSENPAIGVDGSTPNTCFQNLANGSAFSPCNDFTSYAAHTFPHDEVDAATIDKPQGILSSSAFQTIENTLDCGFLPIFFLVGAPTNLLNMIVFFRQGLRDRMNLCLFSLSLVDFLYVLFKFAMGSYCFVGDHGSLLREVWKFRVRKHVVNFMFGALYSSAGLTMIIAVERYVCVVLPMRAATLIKTRTMAALILLTVLAMNALCSVYAFKYEVAVVVLDDVVHVGKVKVMLAASRSYVRHKVTIDVVENVVLSAVTFLNFVVVSVTTGVTVVKLRAAMAWRLRSGGIVTSAERRQVALVKMLVTVSCIYMMCVTPTICLALTRLLVPDFWPQRRYGRMYYVTHVATTVVLMLNSSVNFFVFVMQSSRFRLELRVLVCGRRGKKASEQAPGYPLSSIKWPPSARSHSS